MTFQHPNVIRFLNSAIDSVKFFWLAAGSSAHLSFRTLADQWNNEEGYPNKKTSVIKR